MSTPTMVKFQTSVPSTSGNGGAEETHTPTLANESLGRVDDMGGGMGVTDPIPDETDEDSQTN